MGNAQTTSNTSDNKSEDQCTTCDTEKCNPKLVNTVKNYYRHIVLCTGGEDWVPKIEKDPESLAGKFKAVIKEQTGNNLLCYKLLRGIF